MHRHHHHHQQKWKKQQQQQLRQQQTELRVKKCQCLIFSPSSGAKKTKNCSSVSSARLLKFDGRMTFLSYFCQSDNDENTNENNKTEATAAVQPKELSQNYTEN